MSCRLRVEMKSRDRSVCDPGCVERKSPFFLCPPRSLPERGAAPMREGKPKVHPAEGLGERRKTTGIRHAEGVCRYPYKSHRGMIISSGRIYVKPVCIMKRFLL